MLDPTKSASKATAGTIGVNWFLNKYALIRLDYEYVSFSGGGQSKAPTVSKGITTYNVADRPSEQVLSTRFQLAF